MFLSWLVKASKIRMSPLYSGGKVVGSDTVRESVCISDDPAVHIESARRYINLGFNHLIFHSAGPDQRAFLEGYGRDVLPRLREVSSGKETTESLTHSYH